MPLLDIPHLIGVTQWGKFKLTTFSCWSYPKMALTDTLIKTKTHKDTGGQVKVAPYKLYDEKPIKGAA